MSNQSGFDYDVLISRLHGGVRAFQSLRAHRRQRDQPPAPAPEERPPPQPPRSAQPPPGESGEMRGATPLEPQAFIAVNGRVVPLFGDLGPGMAHPPASAAAAPPLASDPPPPPSRPAPTPASAETPPSPPPTAPAPAPSPLKLPLPTPPARLGLITGGQPRPTESAATTASSDTPAPAPAPRDTTALTALLDARVQQEAARLEKLHAEHRAFVEKLLRDHQDALRAQSEAHAVVTAQLLRDVLAEHRAELARATQTHTEQFAQILALHRQETQAERKIAARPDDGLRAALIEQAKVQREANEEIAEHIGALTTIVADLGQTVGLIAVASIQRSHHELETPAAPIRGDAPSTTTTATIPCASSEPATAPPVPFSNDTPPKDHARASPPPQDRAVSVTTRDRDRILRCVDEDREDDDLDMNQQDGLPCSRQPPHPLSAHPGELGDG